MLILHDYSERAYMHYRWTFGAFTLDFWVSNAYFMFWLDILTVFILH